LTTGSLFLVSVFATTTARSFDPRLLTAASSARQLRPTRIVAITPGWTTRSVGSGMTESAIYRFDRRMELERDLTFVYGDLRSRSWASVAPQVEAELVRARARAGGEGPHSPNFRIFR
jgi:hypothetical protein